MFFQTLINFLFTCLDSLVEATCRLLIPKVPFPLVVPPGLSNVVSGLFLLSFLYIVCRFLPYVKRGIKVTLLSVGVFSLIVVTRFLYLALPRWYAALQTFVVKALNQFDDAALRVADLGTAALGAPFSDVSEDSGVAVSIVDPWSSVFVIVAIATALAGMGLLIKNRLFGTGTEDHTSCSTMTSSTPLSSTVPLSAPTSQEPLYELLRAILTTSTSTSPTSSTTSAELRQLFAELKAELLQYINDQFTILTSTVSHSMPSVSLISKLVDDAVTEAVSNLLARETSQSTAMRTARPTNSGEFTSQPQNATPSCDALDDEFPSINVAGAWRTVRNRGVKKTTTAPKSTTSLPAEPTIKETTTQLPLNDMRTIDELKEEELREVLRQRVQERRTAPSRYLSEEEKNMTMDELHRKWKIEGQKAREERVALNPFDFKELGELTEEQKLLPKYEIRKIIRNKKNDL